MREKALGIALTSVIALILYLGPNKKHFGGKKNANKKNTNKDYFICNFCGKKEYWKLCHKISSTGQLSWVGLPSHDKIICNSCLNTREEKERKRQERVAENKKKCDDREHERLMRLWQAQENRRIIEGKREFWQ